MSAYLTQERLKSLSITRRHLLDLGFSRFQSCHGNGLRVGGAYYGGRMRRDYELVLGMVRQDINQLPCCSRMEKTLRFIDCDYARKWRVHGNIQHSKHLAYTRTGLV